MTPIPTFPHVGEGGVKKVAKKSFVSLGETLSEPSWLKLIHSTTKEHKVVHKVTQREE